MPDTEFLSPVTRPATPGEIRYLRLVGRASQSALKTHFRRLVRLPVILGFLGGFCWLTVELSEGVEGMVMIIFALLGLGLTAVVIRDVIEETRAAQRKLSSAIRAGRVQAYVVDAASIRATAPLKDKPSFYFLGLPDDQTLVLKADDFSVRKFPCLHFTLLDFLDETGAPVWHHIRYRSSKVGHVDTAGYTGDRSELSSLQLLPGPPSRYIPE